MSRPLPPWLQTLFPLLTGAGAMLYLTLAHSVPSSGWRLLMDFGLVGAGLGLWLLSVLSGWQHRRGRLSLVLGGLVLGGLGVTHLLMAPPAAGVILIVVDCLNEERLSEELMPRTRAALEDSWHFTDARAQSSWTRSSMPSLLTGTYPVQHGLYRLSPEPDQLQEGIEGMAPAFKRQGWLTAAFVDQAQLDPAFGLAEGFDRFNFRDGSAAQLQAKFRRWHLFARLVPRFAYLHYLDIHKPYLPEPDYLQRELPAPESDLGPEGDWAGLMKAVNDGERELSLEEWISFELLHEAEIRALDDQLGALLEELHEDGTLASSWLVLTSDHGEAFGEHDYFTHGDVPYEELLTIPMVIRPPGGLDARVEVGAPTQQVDLLPTLLARLAIPPWEELAGRDMGPAMAGSEMAITPTFAEFYAHDDHILSVREGDLKYIWFDGEDHLFDLRRDPGEKDNIVASQPLATRRLRNMGVAYLERGLRGESLREVDWSAEGEIDRPWPNVMNRQRGASPEEASLEALRALGYMD